MSLNEKFAEQLQDLLYTLKLIKYAGNLVDGVPAISYFNFAKSEIVALHNGTMTKDECKGCSDCCILPRAVVPAAGPDGGLARPMRYAMKYEGQPCWWLRSSSEGFKCALHDTGEEPFTCLSYVCSSPEELRATVRKGEEKEQCQK